MCCSCHAFLTVPNETNNRHVIARGNLDAVNLPQ